MQLCENDNIFVCAVSTRILESFLDVYIDKHVEVFDSFCIIVSLSLCFKFHIIFTFQQFFALSFPTQPPFSLLVLIVSATLAFSWSLELSSLHSLYTSSLKFSLESLTVI